ncbi:MAG TPA: GumC family protein [Caulobacteraceae bacterium]|nr:GumC family protein [Caulobacteraceae bacterium]
MTDSAWATGGQPAAPFRKPDAVLLRPRYAPADFVALLWRERALMLSVFLIIMALGFTAALFMKTTYQAQSSLLVRLGQEYVYEPNAGDAAAGAVPESDEVMQSEVEILSSAQVKERVLDRVGLERVFPSIGKGYDSATPEQRRLMVGRAVAAMEKSLKIGFAPGAPVVRVTYEHTDPEMAAQVLNALLEEYLIYRRSILLDPTAPIEAQRKAFEARLAEADEAYESFLGSNNIGDFETEKTSLAQLQANLQQQKYQTDEQLHDRQGRLASLGQQAGQVAPEIGLYRDVDHTAQDKLTDLKIQRQNLLSRYKPDAAPVHELDVQIAALASALASGQVVSQGAKRVGVNPVYQTVQSDQIQLTAEVAALKSASDALAEQINQVTERQLRLAQLEPQYQDLTRDRDVLSNNVRDFTVKEQQTEAANAVARDSNDNISIIQRAVTPTQGSSLKRPVLILSFLFALCTALAAGFARAFMRPGFSTAAMAGRTLDLPVLATAGLKAG